MGKKKEKGRENAAGESEEEHGFWVVGKVKVIEPVGVKVCREMGQDGTLL